MDLSYVKKLIKILSDSEVDEIELEEEGKKIRLVKHVNNTTSMNAGMPTVQLPFYPPSLQAPPVAVPPSPGGSQAVEAAPQKKLHEIKSPIVGTFYKAPAPDAAPFVEVGSAIQIGTPLCIIEAMKLMNEIESDVSGKISKIMVENGQAVEYGQALFLVELV